MIDSPEARKAQTAALAERLEQYRQADGYHVPATAPIGMTSR